MKNIKNILNSLNEEIKFTKPYIEENKMKNEIKNLIKVLNDQEIYTALQLAGDVLCFAKHESIEERTRYFFSLINGSASEPDEAVLVGTRLLCGTTAHKEFVAKCSVFSQAERAELMEFFCDCLTDDNLKDELYDFIDQHLEIIDQNAVMLAQWIEIKGENFTTQYQSSPSLDAPMSMPSKFAFLTLTPEEQDILMQAGLPSFNAIQTNRSISTIGFLKCLARMEDREEFVGFDRGSQAHLSLLEKLNLLEPYEMDRVFNAVMQSWYEQFGELAEMNMRFNKDQLKEILKSFHRMHQIALIDVAQSAKDYVYVGISELIDAFRRTLCADGDELGGVVIPGSDEHLQLIAKFDSLDEAAQKTLALACISYWFYPENQEENFGWVFESSFSMTNREYVLSQL